MARLAATEHGADWVINGDADEFWWPRGGSLPEVLAAVPRRYGIAQSFVRHFVPVADDGRPFQERMTLPAHARPPRSTIPRARGGRTGRSSTGRLPTSFSSRAVTPSVRRPSSRCAGWYPIECLHFPLRTPAQVERKGRAWGDAVEKFYASRAVARAPGPPTTRSSTRPRPAARSTRTTPRSRSRPTTAVEGIAGGLLAEDTRVRDALRVVAEGGSADVSRAVDPRDRVVRGRGRRARRGGRRPHPALARRPRAARRPLERRARTGPSGPPAGSLSPRAG